MTFEKYLCIYHGKTKLKIYSVHIGTSRFKYFTLKNTITFINSCIFMNNGIKVTNV